jgi:hypothetical protein
VRFGVALANGTVALEAALRAVGVRAGDEVIVPARTFIATASSVVAVGGIPVIVDVDRDSGNITADTVEAAITSRTRAVVVVHLGGWPCEMTPIQQLCRVRGLRLIEDCAQAHGASYRSRRVGGLSDVGAFSFCQDKIMTTAGEGGMIVTDDAQVARAVAIYKDHGKHPELLAAEGPSPAFRWVHGSFGTNWRLTEVQSAIGRVQLRKLPGWLHARRRNARFLLDRLESLNALRVPRPAGHLDPAWYKLYVYVRPELLRPGWSRDRILTEIRAAGVPCFGGSSPDISRERAFSAHGLGSRAPLEVARELGETSLMFLVDHTLDLAALERTCQVAERVAQQACDDARGPAS